MPVNFSRHITHLQGLNWCWRQVQGGWDSGRRYILAMRKPVSAALFGAMGGTTGCFTSAINFWEPR